MSQSRFQIIIPPGVLAITLDDQAIVDIALHARPLKQLSAARTTAQKQIASELQAYFADAGAPLTWQLQFQGTDYQQRIWRALRRIPVGQVKTYGELAHEVGGSPRSVGNACRQNPIPLYIPCHRVVASNGGIGGFAGQRQGPRIDLKRWLLQHEGVAPFA